MLNRSNELEASMNQGQRCLLSILQRGLAHARRLVLEGKSKVAADLLDSLDNIALAVTNYDGTRPEDIHQQLKTFESCHPEEVSNYTWMFESKYSLFANDDTA